MTTIYGWECNICGQRIAATNNQAEWNNADRIIKSEPFRAAQAHPCRNMQGQSWEEEEEELDIAYVLKSLGIKQ